MLAPPRAGRDGSARSQSSRERAASIAATRLRISAVAGAITLAAKRRVSTSQSHRHSNANFVGEARIGPAQHARGQAPSALNTAPSRSTPTPPGTARGVVVARGRAVHRTLDPNRLARGRPRAPAYRNGTSADLASRAQDPPADVQLRLVIALARARARSGVLPRGGSRLRYSLGPYSCSERRLDARASSATLVSPCIPSTSPRPDASAGSVPRL